ncbi:MAG TPA: rod shape-determining protein MreC [Anaeromyxobacter sp.]|nr:rod shape-determining protein MreC [Anaeromyxobacter sp.]
MFALLKRYRELILVAVLLLVPLGVFFAHAKQPPERSALDRAIVWLSTPIEKAIGWTARGVLGAWNGYVALRGARQEAGELRNRVRDLELERQQLLVDRAEAERLRRLLAFAEESPERRYVGARVIGVRLGTVGLQVLTIDRGSDDGIAKLMPVVVGDGVVGRVLAVGGHSADVLALTDRNSSIAVRVERTRARANVRGLGKPDAAKLEYALRSEDIIEGDAIVTSGTDGVFPRGLKVGKLTALERTAHGLFQEARVVPAVDVTHVEEVLVLTSWERPGEVLPAAYAPGRRK